MATRLIGLAASHRLFWLALILVAAATWRGGAAAQSLPADIQAAIRKDYVVPGMETRYLDGSVDLNGDGNAEVVVHVVGGGACGTGGCPTLVFTRQGTGYRLVSTITVSNPPIRASDTVTQGWKNLIVHVSGGGAKAHDAELAFDGTSYPRNPTVAGARVKPASAQGGQVIIGAFTSFDQAKPLPKPGDAPPAAKPPAPAASPVSAPAPSGAPQPSFDCAKATTPVEKVVCGDPTLAALDSDLARAYAGAMRTWPEDAQVKERAAQRAWMASRNACSGSGLNACVEARYRQRLVEVQIRGGQLTAPAPVTFVCEGPQKLSFTAAFYNQTEPASAVFTFGGRQTIALSARTASGARYANAEVDFWEHQGEAKVTWLKAAYTCKPR